MVVDVVGMVVLIVVGPTIAELLSGDDYHLWIGSVAISPLLGQKAGSVSLVCAGWHVAFRWGFRSALPVPYRHETKLRNIPWVDGDGCYAITITIPV